MWCGNPVMDSGDGKEKLLVTSQKHGRRRMKLDMALFLQYNNVFDTYIARLRLPQGASHTIFDTET